MSDPTDHILNGKVFKVAEIANDNQGDEYKDLIIDAALYAQKSAKCLALARQNSEARNMLSTVKEILLKINVYLD